MSYCFAGISVKSPKENVIKYFEEFINKKGSFEKIPFSDVKFRERADVIVSEKDEWTTLAFTSSKLYPKLEAYIAEKTNSKVIAIDVYETVGLQHFSVMENNELKTIFTIIDGEILDQDLDVDLYKQLSKEKGVDISDEYEVMLNIYDLFNSKVAEINVEEEVLDILESGSDCCYKANFNEYFIGGTDESFGWKDLLKI